MLSKKYKVRDRHEGDVLTRALRSYFLSGLGVEIAGLSFIHVALGNAVLTNAPDVDYRKTMNRAAGRTRRPVY